MKKIFPKVLLASMVGAMLFSSCATIFGKSNYPISINSNPNNAKISITDKKGKEVYLGNTPATVTLKSGAGFFSKAEYQVKISSSGFDDKIVPINFKLNGWYFGNLLIGGVLGMLIIDPATGAMWKVDSNFVNETLSKSTTAYVPELRFMDINQISAETKSHLIEIK